MNTKKFANSRNINELKKVCELREKFVGQKSLRIWKSPRIQNLFANSRNVHELKNFTNSEKVCESIKIMIQKTFMNFKKVMNSKINHKFEKSLWIWKKLRILEASQKRLETFAKNKTRTATITYERVCATYRLPYKWHYMRQLGIGQGQRPPIRRLRRRNVPIAYRVARHGPAHWLAPSRSLASVYGLLVPFIRSFTGKLLVQEEITGSVFFSFLNIGKIKNVHGFEKSSRICAFMNLIKGLWIWKSSWIYKMFTIFFILAISKNVHEFGKSS